MLAQTRSLLDDKLRTLPKHPLKTLRRGALAMARKETPLLTQLVVIRRCNLTCGYCNEYDDYSEHIRNLEVNLMLLWHVTTDD